MNNWTPWGRDTGRMLPTLIDMLITFVSPETNTRVYCWWFIYFGCGTHLTCLLISRSHSVWKHTHSSLHADKFNTWFLHKEGNTLTLRDSGGLLCKLGSLNGLFALQWTKLVLHGLSVLSEDIKGHLLKECAHMWISNMSSKLSHTCN